MPNYLDIFAGAGGLSEGFIRAGYEPIAHIEMDKAACYTLKTRLAYKWLSEHQESATYTRYLKREITRKELYLYLIGRVFPVQVFPRQGYPRLDLPELDLPVQVFPV